MFSSVKHFTHISTPWMQYINTVLTASGVCHCDEGYVGATCGLSLNQVPEIQSLPQGGLCDLQERPCRETPVQGSYFLATANLTCKLQSYKVTWKAFCYCVVKFIRVYFGHPCYLQVFKISSVYLLWFVNLLTSSMHNNIHTSTEVLLSIKSSF